MASTVRALTGVRLTGCFRARHREEIAKLHCAISCGDFAPCMTRCQGSKVVSAKRDVSAGDKIPHVGRGRIGRLRRSKNPAADSLLPGGRRAGMKGMGLYAQVRQLIADRAPSAICW